VKYQRGAECTAYLTANSAWRWAHEALESIRGVIDRIEARYALAAEIPEYCRCRAEQCLATTGDVQARMTPWMGGDGAG
jgi:hypothetical protein